MCEWVLLHTVRYSFFQIVKYGLPEVYMLYGTLSHHVFRKHYSEILLFINGINIET